MNDKPTLAWPHNRRHLLPPGFDRQTYDTQRFYACYANVGMFPDTARVDHVPAFRPMANRASRRVRGQRGDGYGAYFRPQRSPRAARPYDGVTTRATVGERQRRRAPGRIAGIMRGVPLTPEERAAGRYFVATEEQAQLLRDLMRAL